MSGDFLAEFMSLEEAAALLGLKAGTLRKQALRGAFRARKMGQTYITTETFVEEYRREHLGRVGRPKGGRG